jgi:hypothetical protein
MKIEQIKWTPKNSWVQSNSSSQNEKAQLVFVFGSNLILKNHELLDLLKKYYPNASFLGCSTAGEILDTNVYDDSLVTTAIQFDRTVTKIASVNISDHKGNSFQTGAFLSKALLDKQLKHILVFSDGINVNGSELAKGLEANLPETISVTGGLAGDGDRFLETHVICGDTIPQKGIISALGFYNDNLKVGYGSIGGWDAFGPERLITSSKGNILYELDGRSALDLYKEYLGEYAKSLPASALFFPLSVRSNLVNTAVVRTILAVDEKNKTMTFAGDVPEGSYARLMKANLDRLIEGSASAARIAHEALNFTTPDLAILISCVGRKMVLRQRADEGIEAVRKVFGPRTPLVGYYSYGELCPRSRNTRCELHNQTMTITAFAEN